MLFSIKYSAMKGEGNIRCIFWNFDYEYTLLPHSNLSIIHYLFGYVINSTQIFLIRIYNIDNKVHKVIILQLSYKNAIHLVIDQLVM